MNAGCRATTIQKLLGHQRLNSTLIYARVHDRTVAEDYHAAMEQVEKRMEITPPMKDGAGPSVNKSERDQLLELAAQLATRNLSMETRLGLVDRMRQVLNHGTPMEKQPLENDPKTTTGTAVALSRLPLGVITVVL